MDTLMWWAIVVAVLALGYASWLAVNVKRQDPGTERMVEVARAIQKFHGREVGLVQTEPTLLQLTHPQVSKAVALALVARHLGVPREAVMAIGDNANDVGMLQLARIGVAMGNAVPAARAAANFVTDHHDADGAANAIIKLIFNGNSC